MIIFERAIEASRDMDTPIQHAAMLLNDADNRAKWAKLDAKLNDLVEVVDDGRD